MKKRRLECLMMVALTVLLMGALWCGYRLSERYGDRIAEEYFRLTQQVFSHIDDIHEQIRA